MPKGCTLARGHSKCTIELQVTAPARALWTHCAQRQWASRRVIILIGARGLDQQEDADLLLYNWQERMHVQSRGYGLNVCAPHPTPGSYVEALTSTEAVFGMGLLKK